MKRKNEKSTGKKGTQAKLINLNKNVLSAKKRVQNEKRILESLRKIGTLDRENHKASSASNSSVTLTLSLSDCSEDGNIDRYTSCEVDESTNGSSDDRDESLKSCNKVSTQGRLKINSENNLKDTDQAMLNLQGTKNTVMNNMKINSENNLRDADQAMCNPQGTKNTVQNYPASQKPQQNFKTNDDYSFIYDDKDEAAEECSALNECSFIYDILRSMACLKSDKRPVLIVENNLLKKGIETPELCSIRCGEEYQDSLAGYSYDSDLTDDFTKYTREEASVIHSRGIYH